MTVYKRPDQPYNYSLAYDKINPLPADGFPRITSEGLRILKEGLEGDFTNWAYFNGNHTQEIPADMIHNAGISADPETRHYQIKIWHGLTCPQVDYLNLAPTIEFDKIEVWPPVDDKKEYVIFKNSKEGFFTPSLIVLLDDYGQHSKNRTIYKTVWEMEKEQQKIEIKPHYRTKTIFDFGEVE